MRESTALPAAGPGRSRAGVRGGSRSTRRSGASAVGGSRRRSIAAPRSPAAERSNPGWSAA